MWTLKQTNIVHRYREQIGGCLRWGVGVRTKWGEGDQNVCTSSYKINKSWRYNYSMVTVMNNTVLYI